MFGVGTIGRIGRADYSAARGVLPLPILDQLGITAEAAYSRRKLRADASLADRVRRSSDNAEANIGFATAVQTRTNLAAIPINNAGGAGGAGITMTTVGTGTEFGQPYVEVRWQGTATATTELSFSHGPQGAFNPITQAPVTPGLAYAVSFGFRLVAGTFPPGSPAILALNFNAAGGVTSVPTSGVPAATAALQRGAVNFTPPAGTAYVQPRWRIGAVPSGTVVDFTMRFYAANVEQGIGNARPLLQRNVPEVVADIGDFDAEALLAFVGTGNGFDATSNDQSGNGRNATQTDPTKQPQIVSNGAIVTQNGRAMLRFDGNDVLNFQGVHDAQWSLAVVGRMNGSSQAFLQFGGINQFGSMFNEAGTYRARPAGGANAFAPFTPGEIVVLTATYGAAQTNIWKNGSIGTPSDAAGVASNAASTIGSLQGLFFLNGFISEIIVLNGVLSTTDRQILERNQGAYFGITVA
jgi:hypothetical protein